MAVNIHPMAIVDKKAEIDENVEIGPFSIIGPKVKIGKGTIIGDSVRIDGLTEIGENNRIFHGAAIGIIPQDLKFAGEEGKVIIGNNNSIREFVTIHSPCEVDEFLTKVGNNCLLMCYVHIAHNCILGDNIIISNTVNIAGHSHIHDHAIIGGSAAVHQFSTIGKYSFVGGMVPVTMDILPFMQISGNPARIIGPNVVGLKRKGFSDEQISNIKKMLRILTSKEDLLNKLLEKIESEFGQTVEGKIILEFFKVSKRPVLRSRNIKGEV